MRKVIKLLEARKSIVKKIIEDYKIKNPYAEDTLPELSEELNQIEIVLKLLNEE